jgi:hypothetical protein
MFALYIVCNSNLVFKKLGKESGEVKRVAERGKIQAQRKGRKRKHPHINLQKYQILKI